MRYANATVTLALFLAITGTFAAPLPRHSQGEEDVEPSHPNHTHGHHHHHHHNHSRHRVSLAKWIHAHLHYPHHWPFHPHHDTQHHQHHLHGVEKNERPKSSGSMFRFWLHSHFAPHTSKLRTHRGKPISDGDQKVLSSSFNDKPPSDEDGLKARDLETHSTPESGGEEGSHELHHELHHHVKELHKAGHKLHTLGKMVEEMGNVHDAVEKLHLRVGLAASNLGNKGEKESRRKIDELD